MSLPDNNINPKILESAKQEFLAVGFQNASLRKICEKAGVTTGALYKRFSGKDALFEAVVSPVLKDMVQFISSVEKFDNEQLEQNQMGQVWEMSEETMKSYIEFAYDRYDCFKLLLCCSEGSAYSNFVHDFVASHTKQTMAFAEKALASGLASNGIDEDELHILLTAFWTAFFETIVHDFPKEKALHHCRIVNKLFNWRAIMGF